MKKTYIKLMWRGVSKTRARFFSILAIVAIGVGFLGGLIATTPDMQLTVDEYYDENNVYDIDVKSTLGITQDDVEKIKGLDSTKEVMPAYVTDINMQDDSGTYATRLYGLDAIKDGKTDYMNQVVLISGRMPKNKNECVILAPNGYSEKYTVGDVFKISENNKNYDSLGDTYDIDGLTVVGIVKSPLFLSYESEPCSIGTGTVELVIFASSECYKLDVYTDCFVTVNGAAQVNAFSNDYTKIVDNAAEEIKTLGIDRSEIRKNDVISEAESKLDDAKKEYDDAKTEADAKLADAKAQLDDGEKKLEDGKAELADKKQELEDSKKKLADAQTELDSTIKSKTDEFYSSLDSLVQEQYDKLYAQITSARDEAQAEIDKNKAEIAKKEAELLENEKNLSEKEQELKAGREQYNQALAEYNVNAARLSDAQALIDSGRQQLADSIKQSRDELEANKPNMSEDEYQQAKAQIDAAEISGNQNLDAQQAQLDPKLEQLVQAKKQLDATDASLTQGETAVADGKAKIESGKTELDAAKKQLDDAQKKLNNSISENIEKLKASLPTIRSQILSAGLEQIEEARAEAQTQIDDSQAQLTDGEQQIKDAEKEIAASEKELADGKKEYEDKKAEADEKLADAKKQLDDAEKKISDISDSKWYVLDRGDTVSYTSYDSNSQKVAAVAQIFPLFFFLVAALVALTTMTRLVEEERGQIGTLKALGYGNKTILLYYVLYSMVAALAGSFIGIFIGYFTLPYIIANAYSMMFTIPATKMVFHVGYAMIIIPIAVFCTVAATLFACYEQLKEKPSHLMLQRAPKAGKRILLERITPIWKRLSFTKKVAARNIFRYKKRLLMTVVGIAGCCALLVAGFGLRDSISDIVGKQFGEIYKYDLTLSLADNGDAEKDQNLSTVLNDSSLVKSYSEIHSETVRIGGKDVNLFVPKTPEGLTSQINLRNFNTGKAIEFNENSVVITQKLSETLNVNVGDQITVSDLDGKTYKFTVTGVAESYISSYLFISSEAYSSAFGKQPEFKTLLVQTVGGDQQFRDSLSEKLLESDNITYIKFLESVKESFNNMLSKIDYIVMVLILCAGGLAMVVLYNLTNINICERKKELATLKVLGFHGGETAMYIYRETTILCLIGIAAGFVLGMFLHRFVVYCAEVDSVMFGRTVAPMSYFLAALITIVFTVIVDLIMMKKLKNIDMVESMKANE